MEAPGTKSRDTLPAPKLVLRVVAYYMLLAVAFVLVRFLTNAPVRILPSGPLNAPEAPDSLGTIGLNFFRQAGDAIGSGPSAGIAILAMSGAALLALPVAWLYTLTRQKRGYRQSVVQTLVLLPTVVAGVVVLVKGSLPLAFSLAGIMAAVRFRNTLEDSKDAVYIFLATGIGLAAGVDLSVAVILSVIFNLLSLALWWANFGKSPVRLEGRTAERKIENALAMANRTGMFVAQIDKQILQELAPEQLDALADRAWRRRKRNSPDKPIDPQARDDTLLRVRTTAVDATRRAVEPLLDEHVKRWRFGGVVHEADGTHTVEYGVRLRKRVGSEELLASLRTANTLDVIDMEVK